MIYYIITVYSINIKLQFDKSIHKMFECKLIVIKNKNECIAYT